MNIIIYPDLDGGEQPVEGQVVVADCDTIAIRRSEPYAGNRYIPFPRTGYRVQVES